MKTAISLPDELFYQIEALARLTHKTRSQLYRAALQEYLARHSPEQVTETMNQTLDQLNEPTDPFISEAVCQIMERIEW
jgi:metal-responsive CopG/Arc/MetJ family transcriptional regulator